MTKTIGRRTPLWIKLESTRLSGETTGGHWIPWVSFEKGSTVTYAQNTGAVGNIFDNIGSDVIKKHAEPTVEFDFYDDLAPYVHLFALGSGAALTSLGTGALSGSGILFNSNEPMTFTLGYSGTDAQWVSSGNVVNTLEITADATGEDFAKVSVSFVGTDWVSGATLPAPTFSSSMKKYRPQDLAVSFSSGATALGTSRNVRNATLTINRNAEPDWSVGNQSPSNFFAKQYDVSATVETTWDNGDTASNASGFWKWHQDGFANSMRFSFVNTRVLSGAQSPLFQADLHKVNVIEHSVDTGLDDLIMQTATLKASYDLATASGITTTVKAGITY